MKRKKQSPTSIQNDLDYFLFLAKQGNWRFRGFILLIVFLISSVSLFAQARIVHNPPQNATSGEALTIECQLEGMTSSVRLARVYYRGTEDEEYKFIFLTESANQWRGTIPAADVSGQRLQYFIAIRLQDERILTFPENSGQFSPEEIILGQGSSTKSAAGATDALFFLSPEADQILEPTDVIIAASFDPRIINASSITLTLNGRDLTSFATLSDYILTFVPNNLASGAHRLVLSASDTTGAALPLVEHLFFVRTEKERAPRAEFTGRVFTDWRREDIYNQDESFVMGGAEFNGTYGSLGVRGRIFVTSLEDKSYQPRNRFSLAVEHEHFTIEAGDIYPRYNDLMIWGKRVRGLAGRVHAGVFTLDAVFGQTYRAVEGSSPPSINNAPSITNAGTFQQNLIGVRPGLKFKDTAQFGLSVLKMKDDASSIHIGIRPKDNLVFGPDFLLSLHKGRIELRAYAAYSMLTYDTRIGAFSKTDIENMFSGNASAPINPAAYKSLLVINDTTVPLDPTKFTSAAYDVHLKLNYYRNLFKLGFKRIGSDYFSLANSWLRKDIRGFYLSDRVRLFQNKFYMILGLERYTDNFSQEGIKPALDLNSLNAALSYYPGKGLPSITVNVRDYSRVNGITDVQIDSLTVIGALDTTDYREESRQRDINIQLGYQVDFLQAAHYFTLGYVTAIKNDNFATTRLPGYFSQEMNSNVNMLTWSSTYSLPLRTSVSFSSNKNVIGDGISDFHYTALSAFGEYAFWQKKLVAFAEYRYTTTDGLTYAGETIDADRNHIRAGAVVHLPQQQTITCEAYVITYSSSVQQSSISSSYNDSILRFRYEKFF